MLAPVTFDYTARLSCRAEPDTAFVFALLPARTHQQQLATERLQVRGAASRSVFTDAASATRYLQVVARGGALEVEAKAQVRLLQSEPAAAVLRGEARIGPLSAPESLRHLMPSRFCPSDRFAVLAEREFGDVQSAFERAMRIEAWVQRHVRLVPPAGIVPGAAFGVVIDAPDAREVRERRAGTPRDLAHLTIALCRASGLPARYVTAVPWGDAGGRDGPDDVHPWVEVLVGETWIALDPSRRMPRTALLRLGTGRDAADVPLAFACGPMRVGRVDWSIGSPDASLEVLRERDRLAEAVCAATLGSLGEATRWHQEARLAARPADDSAEPQRRAPSQVATAAARLASTAPRRGARILVFPGALSPRAPTVGESRGSRYEPVQEPDHA